MGFLNIIGVSEKGPSREHISTDVPGSNGHAVGANGKTLNGHSEMSPVGATQGTRPGSDAHPDNHREMSLTVKVWRQNRRSEKGRMVTYKIAGISPDMSFLEMLDTLNEQLIKNGEDSIAFDHDCREGICGSCALMINGVAHGPEAGTTACQLHMRRFQDGDTIYVEPWRARAFPIIKDLSVDRSALDRIIASGGYVSVNTGNAPDANALPINKELAERAMDAAACISCGACIAQCKNASAALFTGAKIAHLSSLPQGEPERLERARRMVLQMDIEGFGNCSNEGECEAVCPKGISMTNIARMNRDYETSLLKR